MNKKQTLFNLKKRHNSENRFRLYGIISLLLSFSFLIGFFYSIFSSALPALKQTEIKLDIFFDTQIINIGNAKNEEEIQQFLNKINYELLITNSIKKIFNIDAKEDEKAQNLMRDLLSTSAQYQLMDFLKANPQYIGKEKSIWLLASDDLDMIFQGYLNKDDVSLKSTTNNIFTLQQFLNTQGLLQASINTKILFNSDSRSAQYAGIKGALLGSFYTLLVTLLLSFPIAVMAAIYLEEFAIQNRFTQFLEANINNLAAVPSIVFGLLGLVVFIGFFGLLRSTALVGGLVLTLMTLPTIIISSRAAIKSVPSSIRDAALALGASKMQVIFHHVLPLALPGMLTGTIIGMAQALGETAPLLMIGMVAFIADIPSGITDPATVMPVQIYLWSKLPESAFVARTSLAIIILLIFLVLMNATALILRKKFEHKW